MAQIPMGNFGYKQAQLQTGVTQMPSGADTQAAVQMLGTFGEIATRLDAQEQQKADSAEKAKSLLEIQKAENDAGALKQQITDRIDMGELDEKKAGEEWTSGLEKIKGTYGQSMPEKYRDALGLQAEQWKGNGGLDLAKRAKVRTSQTIAGDIEALENESMKNATQDPAGVESRLHSVVDTLGFDANWNDAQRQAKKEQITKNAFVQNASQRTMSDDREELTRVYRELTDDKSTYGAKLDADTRRVLANQAASNLNRIDSVRRAEQSAQEKQAGIEVQIATNMMEGGKVISPEQAVRAQEAAKILGDTDPRVIQYRTTDRFAPALVELSTKTIQSQRLTADQMMKDAEDLMAKDSIAGAQAIALAQKANQLTSQNTSDAVRNPVAYAQERFKVSPPPLDLAEAAIDPLKFNVSLAHRRAYSLQVESMTGVNPGLIFKEEADQLKQQFDNGNDQIRKTIAEGLVNATGKDLSSLATVRNIIASSPVMGTAVALLTSETRDASKVLVGDLIIAGDLAAKKNPDMKLYGTDEVDFDAQYQKIAGTIISGSSTLRANYREAAMATYYAYRAQEGKFTKDHKHDSTLMSKAIMATMETPALYNGAMTIPPKGIEQAEFPDAAKKSLERAYAEHVKAGATNLGTLRAFTSNAILRRNASGSYDVLADKNGTVFQVNYKTGSAPITIEVKK